jgi:predicted ester cyclase
MYVAARHVIVVVINDTAAGWRPRQGDITMMTTTITETAAAFFEACETGRGWDECAQYCHPDAVFAAQSEALGDVTTVQAYTEWLKGLYTFVTDTDYEIRGFGTDPERDCVLVYAVFSGTHTGDGGPIPPTGKSTATDYVYALRFDDGRIAHMTKIWHSGLAMQELGWA